MSQVSHPLKVLHLLTHRNAISHPPHPFPSLTIPPQIGTRHPRRWVGARAVPWGGVGPCGRPRPNAISHPPHPFPSLTIPPQIEGRCDGRNGAGGQATCSGTGQGGAVEGPLWVPWSLDWTSLLREQMGEALVLVNRSYVHRGRDISRIRLTQRSHARLILSWSYF